MKIGKNAEDNWRLFSEANLNDLWFHIDKNSSAHVFLSQDEINKENVIKAALETKAHSKLKYCSKVKIVYTPISNLKKGTKVGEVIIRNQKRCKYIIV